MEPPQPYLPKWLLVILGAVAYLSTGMTAAKFWYDKDILRCNTRRQQEIIVTLLWVPLLFIGLPLMCLWECVCSGKRENRRQSSVTTDEDATASGSQSSLKEAV